MLAALPSTGLESSSCQPRVSIPIVAEVIGEVYGARMVGGAQDTFPLQQKMAVCTLLMLVRGKSLKEVELGKVGASADQAPPTQCIRVSHTASLIKYTPTACLCK